MLVLSSRFAWWARALLSIGFFAGLAVPREALALCIDPTGCVCTSQLPEVAFSATVVSVQGDVHPPLVKLHLDTLEVRPGAATKLAQGGEASVAVYNPPVVGAKVLGFSLLGACTDTDCPGGEVESIRLQSTFTPDGKIACGGGELRIAEPEAIGLVLDSGCREKMNDRLEQAGVDLQCNDTVSSSVGCSVSGAPGTLPLSGALALGLAGIALACRRRR